jgi:hypothetical protein
MIKGIVGRYTSVDGILRYVDILSRRLTKTNRYLRINNDAQVPIELLINNIFDLSPYQTRTSTVLKFLIISAEVRHGEFM